MAIIRILKWMSSACDVFVVINNLLLKIKYKLYVSVLSTSIPFVFASIFKFIVRGPIPVTLPYVVRGGALLVN